MAKIIKKLKKVVQRIKKFSIFAVSNSNEAIGRLEDDDRHI